MDETERDMWRRRVGMRKKVAAVFGCVGCLQALCLGALAINNLLK